MKSVCFIIGDVNFDQLVNVMSSMFLYCKVIITIKLISALWEKTLKLWNIPFCIKLLSTIFFCILWWFLPELVISIIAAKWSFLTLAFLLHVLFGILLSLFLYQNGRMHSLFYSVGYNLLLVIHSDNQLVPELARRSPFSWRWWSFEHVP